MKPTPVAFLNPFVIWSQLAWKSTEMLFSSAQVIQHRTKAIAAAGHRPSAGDRRELNRMWQEKLAAAGESAFWTGAELAKMNVEIGTRVVQEVVRLTLGMWGIALSKGAAQRLLRQQSMLSGSAARSLAHAVRLSESSGKLAHRALEPVHRRATRNAKRLGRKS